LSDADLRGAVLHAANLAQCCLRGADLEKADLSRADFQAADISDADFTASCLRQANMTGVIRSGATEFKGADLSDVVCDSNMSKEIARMKTIANLADRSWRAYSLFLVVGLSAILGGLAGLLLAGLAAGGFKGNAHLGDIGFCVGAGLSAIVAFRKQVRGRKQQSKSS
jgi:uncharacterized protein YjbI with pentapeptide repeats